jgi:hypothetical protein
MVITPADVWIVSSMWTGALSNTDAQITWGSVSVMEERMRCSMGFSFIASTPFVPSSFAVGWRHAGSIPRLVRAVPDMPVFFTVISSVTPASGPSAGAALYSPPRAISCTTSREGYRLSHHPSWPSRTSIDRSSRQRLCSGEKVFLKTGTVLSPRNTRNST